MRSVALGLVVCVAAAGCGDTRFSLLPRGRMSPQDPQPTRPIVETPTAPPWSEQAGKAPRSPLTAGRADAAVSGASVLLWLLGGAAPFVGAYGSFEETGWFTRQAPAVDGPGVATPPR